MKNKSFAAQINRIHPKDCDFPILEYLCSEANKLYNCATYLARQIYFKTKRYVNKYWLATELKSNPHFQAFHSQAAQQVCLGVGESIRSYKGLVKLWRQGEVADRPRFPSYRKKGLFTCSYPRQALKLIDGKVRIPLGTKCKVWFGVQYTYLSFPSNLDWGSVKELQIVPRACGFDAVWIQKIEVGQVTLNPDNWLSIDHGLDNWLTCVSNASKPFIIDGKHLKSLNQFYNKQIAKIKLGKPQGFWCNLLDRITCKRNRQMRDAVNKAARMVINHCIKNDIGTIVFGWNKGQKQSSNMGRKTNQKFVQIPTARLKGRIQQLCEQLGIIFIEQEESYTSKASALDLDDIPVYGEKPDSWKPSGKRVRRGLYKSSDGQLLNADVNGAINIARKAKVTGMQRKPARGLFLTSPVRLRFWSTSPQS